MGDPKTIVTTFHSGPTGLNIFEGSTNIKRRLKLLVGEHGTGERGKGNGRIRPRVRKLGTRGDLGFRTEGSDTVPPVGTDGEVEEGRVGSRVTSRP